jgi:enterochelin esterase family protein
METLNGGGPVMRGGTITFSHADPDGALAGVRLAQERELAKDKLSLDFARGRDSDAWRLRLPRPDVDRMEYLLELVAAGGATRLVCDPANPLRARGPFGEKSVVELPSYRPPIWLANGEPPKGEVVPLRLHSRRLRTNLDGLLWSSPGSTQGEPLPLLVAHDGPEYAEYSSLLELLDAMAGTSQLPAMRAALLAPDARNRDYSALPRYAAALSRDIIPALGQLAPTPDSAEMRIGMGTSLGALAMLHSHRLDPGAFGGLFLQSGSFFRRGTREQEWDFTRQRRITGFVGEVLAASDWDDPIPITMTCGRLEENLENNQAMRDALAAQGYEVTLNVTRDVHNWVAWRDGFDPHLVALLQRAWA